MSDGIRLSDSISAVVGRKKRTKTVNNKVVDVYPKEVEDTLILKDSIKFIRRRREHG